MSRSLAHAGPAEVVEIVRAALERGRELGIVEEIVQALDADVRAARVPTEAIRMTPTEPAPTAAPRGTR